MPPVVAVAGWALAGAAATSALAISLGYFLIGAAQVIGYGLLIGGTYAMSERAKRKAKAQYNASQVDRLVNVGSTTMPRELVLGRVRKGGSVIFRASTGTHRSRFVMVLALAGHECDGIETVYFNDTPVNLDAYGYVTDAPYSKSNVTDRFVKIPAGQTSVVIDSDFVAGSVNASYATSGYGDGIWDYYEQTGVPFTVTGNTVTLSTTYASEITVVYHKPAAEASKARVRWYLGQPGQQADAYLQSLFPGVWTSQHRLTGVTYAICEFLYDETAFASGLPTVTFVMRGAKCFDPRTSQTAWTRNPALQSRHVLTHPQFGQRTSLTATEDSRIVTAANVCDLSVDWNAKEPRPGSWGAIWSAVNAALQAAGVVGTQKLYTGDLVVPYGTPAADVLDDLAMATGGIWAFSRSEFYFKPGIYMPPVMELTQDDLAVEFSASEGGVSQQPITITTHKARVDKINVIKPTIWDAAQDYKSVPLAAVKVDSYVARDGGILSSEVQFTAVNSSVRAAYLSKILLRDARDSLTASLTLKLSAYAVEIFDIIELTIPRYGWNKKPFLVLGRTWTPQGLLKLDVKETSSEIYDMDDEFAVAGFASNTNLPNPWFVPVPVITSVASGTEELTLNSDGSIAANIRVRWTLPDDASFSNGTGTVEVRYGSMVQLGEAASVPTDFNWTTVTAEATALTLKLPNVLDGFTYAIQIRAKNALAPSEWSSTTLHKVVGKTAPPSNVPAVAVTVENNRLTARITPIGDLDCAGYEVRLANSNWGDSGSVFLGDVLTFNLFPYQIGTNTWYIKAYDRSGNYSTTALAFSYTMPALVNVTGVTSLFADTSLTAATVTLSWVDAAPTLGLAGYEITYLSKTVTAKANTITLPADWIGNRTYTIKTVDSAGFKSTGVSTAVEKLAPGPATNFKAQVIDNTVLLFWNLPTKTSLPVSHVLLKKNGATWATATEIGTKDGEFTTLTELAAGTYTYWLAVVDTDGVESEPVSLTTKVSQPPDFIFNGEFNSTFSGTKNNAVVANGYVYLPVNTTETFAQHFTNNAWTTPQAQITAGYPYYPQPGLNTGYYEEVFDFGTILSSSNVSLNLTGGALAGTATVATSLSLSTDNILYVDYPGLSSVYGSNFRYVKARVTVTQGTAGALYELRSVNVRLDAKLKSDAGSTSVTTDVNGTLFNFNSEFVEVVAINPSASGTTLLTAVYDYYDAIQTGTYSVVSGVCTIASTNHKAVVGGKVRLAASTGSLPIGVYTVVSVPNANTLTVNTASANSSGNILMYNNFGRLHLFNSAGTRVAGTVSWSIRGF